MIDPYLYEYRQKEAGMAYVVLLALLAIMATLGLSFAFKVGIETSATETRSDGMQAQYLAEAAANHAMWRLLNESTEDRNIRVEHDNDDSEESDDGSISLGGNKLNLGEERYIGVRFLNVSIPQGATVTNAYITLKACDTDTEHTDITINGENTDDAFPFSANNGDLSGRTKTAAAVNWNDIPNWTDNNYYKTPDLTSIVQEIINRPGWTTGNAMVILFRSEDLNGQRRADTHDSIPGNAPLLYIQFGDSNVAASGVYHMHSLAGGRYGYKIRRHTDTTFATIATVGAVGENVVQQSYVLYILPGCKPGSFRDEFTSAAYDNSDGSLAWAGDWIERDSSGAGPSAGKVVITGGELRMNGTPSGDDPSLAREVDLSGHLYATLSFSFRTGGGVEAGEDSAVVEVSGDGGGSWTVLEDFIDAGGSAAGTRSYDISAYIAENTQVRFRINLLYGGPDEYFYVDDVEIEAICERTLCDNLVGYWRLDESSGSASAWDSSGNGNHGTLISMNPSTSWVPGHMDGAVDLNGSSDYVQTSSSELTTANEFTISLWFKADATDFAHMLLWQGEGIANGWGESTEDVQEMHIALGDFPAGNPQGTSSDNLLSFFLGDVDETWNTDVLGLNTSFSDTTGFNHVVVTVTGLGTSPSAEMFLNGSSVDTDTGTIARTGRGDWDTDLRMGRPGADQRYFDGILDEVRIYNRALDADEIVQLYELTEGGCDPPINNAPFVDAGPDQSLPGPAVETILDGMVADDGLPDPPKTLTTTWSQVSGPGTVIFDDASAINTAAVIPEVGIYTLRLTADDGELATFDDVTIELVLPCNGTYADRFNNPVFNGSNGTIDWSTSPWGEVGESDGPTSGDIRVMSDLGSNRLRLRDNDNGGEGVERQVDLSGAVAAKLIFYYRRNGLDNANDYVKFEISPNGPAGPWTELFRFQGPGTDAAFQMVEVDISAYASSNTRLRFLTSPSMGGTDTVWIDDVYMKCGS